MNMLDNLINLLWYIAYHGFYMFIAAVVFGLLINAAENIKKIPFLLRIILTPISGICAWISTNILLESFVSLISLFWNIYDSEFNLWFYSILVQPAFTSYAFLWAISFMAPTNSKSTTIANASLWIALYLYSLYLVVFQNFVADAPYLLAARDIEIGLFGTFMMYGSAICGLVLAGKKAYEGDLESPF